MGEGEEGREGRREERREEGKKKKLPAVSQSPDLKKEHLRCHVRLITLVGKAGVHSEAHSVACEGQHTAMVTFLLADLTMFPLAFAYKFLN